MFHFPTSHPLPKKASEVQRFFGAIALSYAPFVIDDSSWKSATESVTVALTLTLGGVRKCNSAGFLIVAGGIRDIEVEYWLEMSYIRGNG